MKEGVSLIDSKKYLQQIERLDARIEIKLEEETRLKEMALKTTSAPKEVTVSNGGMQDKFGGIMAKIADVKAEINRLVDRRADIVRTIESVENIKQMKVLYNHYAERKPLIQIASEMGIGYRQARNIHKAGLQAVNQIMQKKG
nr:MAG TPA: Protein of unknown function (DUF1492) [Caudoviricetes sp.]